MKGLLLTCLLCLSISCLEAQEMTVKRERVFTGTGLYGYMNGGAEQFLEYGVTKLTARDLEYDGEEYALEIYEMPTPEDAYGIYSLHVFRCQRADTLGCIDCLSPYQLQTVCGNRYVSLEFPSGSERAQRFRRSCGSRQMRFCVISCLERKPKKWNSRSHFNRFRLNPVS